MVLLTRRLIFNFKLVTVEFIVNKSNKRIVTIELHKSGMKPAEIFKVPGSEILTVYDAMR